MAVFCVVLAAFVVVSISSSIDALKGSGIQALNRAVSSLEQEQEALERLIQDEEEKLSNLRKALQENLNVQYQLPDMLKRIRESHNTMNTNEEISPENHAVVDVIEDKGLDGGKISHHISKRDIQDVSDNSQDTYRQKAVVQTFEWAWKGYREHAWGHDELEPISKSFSEWFGLGLTLIDALDTMYIMGLKSEYTEARNWVAHDLQLDKNVDVNLFECTIRVLGGLLSAYALTGDSMYKDKASDLGERLEYAFNDNSGVPYSDVNLHTHQAHKPKWGPDSSTSEVSTIQIEFKYLAYVTGKKEYAQRVNKIMHHLHDLPKKDGLVPIFINANTGRFSGNTITLGARGDSYYEYLLKQWLLTGKKDDYFKNMYLEAIEGVKKHLLHRTKTDNLLYIGELLNNNPSPKMDHLVCFMPGTLALGAYHGLPHDHLDIAKELIHTCNEMYVRQPTGLAPEIVHFDMGPQNAAIYVKPADAHNLLRPETVESLFIMYRITGDKKYQDWGWEIYKNFEKYCKIASGGYSSLRSVLENPPQYRNKMESFFLGETLKYLYLLFDETNKIDLNEWVFNTEAHPFPVIPFDSN
eukprot:m.23646 g.23646  ORF g.23646 m.23646 type:complete len:582 (-) comp5568_c0_seq2:85-1830(-)